MIYYTLSYLLWISPVLPESAVRTNARLHAAPLTLGCGCYKSLVAEVSTQIKGGCQITLGTVPIESSHFV